MFRKPNQQIINYFYENNNIKSDQLLFVSDNLSTDIKLNNNNNIKSVLVLTGVNNKDDVIKSQVKLWILFYPVLMI